ncbi:hypothetical protein BLA29_011760 [Euroglyphus maynei]|uniref:Uncharacterized protein n=1 Tax=Euroglyphus maynei TaxID=6958 RepID=A0A1Y3ANA2_EURMA|nr:hypothetical protein BLA29_011760 [Euroglyphus maynei]
MVSYSLVVKNYHVLATTIIIIQMFYIGFRSVNSDDYVNPISLRSGWYIPSWLMEQSLPLTSYSQIKRDFKFDLE